MDFYPRISTGADAAPVNYFEYLASKAWRDRRNARLRAAGWKCTECGSRRNLQVHHKTYERLGREWDQDLAVLCVACHEAKHQTEAPHEYVRHYLRLAREVLETGEQYQTLSDFTEALKTRCAREKLYYNSEKLARAISLVWKDYKTAPPAVVTFVVDTWERPPSRGEARQILRNVGALEAAERMPTMPPADYLITTQRDADRQKALEMVAREIQASIDRCAELETAEPEKAES